MAQSKQKLSVGAIALLVLIAVIGLIAKQFQVPQTEPTKPEVTDELAPSKRSDHLVMGNPSKAKADPAEKNNYLLEKDQYALSYNNSKGTPNWASWRLCKGDMGTTPRKDAFHPEELLPAGFHRVKPGDYRFTETNFDRGHLCPNADRDRTEENAKATFSMANMMPQSHELNGGPWADLEDYCREQASKGKELYIVTGPSGMGGTTKKGKFDTIGDDKITVPAQCWKVVLILDDKDGDDVARVTKDTRTIAVIMPNNTDVQKPWPKYQVNVDQVEKLTGYKFFTKVPDNTLDKLKIAAP